jgi:hypothetical protein
MGAPLRVAEAHGKCPCFHVRDAFPSLGLSTSITQGIIGAEETLQITCEQKTGAAVFGDGIEEDRLEPPCASILQSSCCAHPRNNYVSVVAANAVAYATVNGTPRRERVG